VRMSTGKSSDRYDSTYYVSVGSPTHLGLSSSYPTFLAEYGYYPTTEPAKATVLLHDLRQPDSIANFKRQYSHLEVLSFSGIQSRYLSQVTVLYKMYLIRVGIVSVRVVLEICPNRKQNDHARRKERSSTGRFDYLRSDRQVKVCLSMFFLYFYQGLDCFGLSLVGT
jgi:hypothetical protein